jgi:1-acyl-sn-glycerol-3-phosphate acyltransferase
MIWLTIVGLFIAAILLPLVNEYKRSKLIRWWCQNLLSAFNIRVIRSGFIPSIDRPLRNVMVVANHISWSDIHALNSVTPLKFIAKSEIKSWPIFGYLAKTNAIFIDRTKRHEAANTVEMLTENLKAGANVCLFPEGTTTVGNEVKPFKSSLVQAAIQAESTIYPVAIHYPHPNGGSNTQMAYAGQTTLTESLQQVLLQRAPVVELRFLAPIHVKNLTAAEKDRRVLTAHIQQLITNALFEQKAMPL